MRLLNILLFTILFFYIPVQAQNIKGKLKDSLENVPLENTSISLLQVKDSVLVVFSRANAKGEFALKKPANGVYQLLISHPKFADFTDSLMITESNQEIDLGTIFLLSKRKAYEEVLIKAKVAPVRIKGDTIIYTADSFKVRDGANVEDLLRKLPGIQVGRNGEIKAMGETVKNVLVDGEEFFGSDPGVAIKNLQANAVDKVEVFDKKSDQAAFTGIDDGVKEKTINLKLKDNKKNGYFGKVETGGGTPDNYDAQAMINAFKKKRKFSAFVLTGNIGNTNLGWEENQKYGGSEGMEMGMGDGGGMWMNYSGDDFGSGGIPKNWNGGLHYSNKFNGDKQSVNFGYKYNKINSNAENRTYAKTFLPDTSWNDNSGSNQFSTKFRNQINGSIETKLDSFNVLKFTMKVMEQQSEDISESFNRSFTETNPINESTRKNSNQAKKSTYNGTALWMHKFKKANRTFSINFSANYSENDRTGFLYSLNKYYKNGNLLLQDTIDQQKINATTDNSFNTRISYTEPLTKKLTAEISYALAQNYNDNNQQSFDKDAGGKYTQLAQAFSNHYTFSTIVHAPSAGIKYTGKILTAGIGTKLGWNHFRQKNVSTNLIRTYDFSNIFPNANFNFKLKGNKNIRLNYNGSGTAPTLNDLQPIQDNTDPFNIVIGNPDLKQSFNHNFSGNFNMWNLLKEKNIWSYASFSTTKNDRTQYSIIDSFGRTISKTVNINGNFGSNGGFNYGFKWKKPGIGIGFGPNYGISRRNDFVNGQRNITKTTSYGISVNMDKWVEEKMSFWMNIRYNKNRSTASVNQASRADYRTLSGSVEGSVTLPWKLEITQSINFFAQQKDPRFPRNSNYFLWNVGIQKEIIKKVFKARFSINDLLNQNRGFDRSFSSFNYSENYYNTLKRYWLVTLTYNFNSQKTKTTPNAK